MMNTFRRITLGGHGKPHKSNWAPGLRNDLPTIMDDLTNEAAGFLDAGEMAQRFVCSDAAFSGGERTGTQHRFHILEVDVE